MLDMTFYVNQPALDKTREVLIRSLVRHIFYSDDFQQWFTEEIESRKKIQSSEEIGQD